ncbi:MAG TPA: hypothetical protein VKB88_32355 [Bryobacteraceae bacterium]|nr:hypothetical protein [Bryobacteraceae bacterium]
MKLLNERRKTLIAYEEVSDPLQLPLEPEIVLLPDFGVKIIHISQGCVTRGRSFARAPVFEKPIKIRALLVDVDHLEYVGDQLIDECIACPNLRGCRENVTVLVKYDVLAG